MPKPDFERFPIELNHLQKSRIIAINACKPFDPDETGEVPEPDLAKILPRVWQQSESMGSDWRVNKERLRLSLNKFYLNLTSDVSDSVAIRTQAVFEEIRGLNPAIQTTEDLRIYLEKLGVQTAPLERQTREATLFSSTTAPSLLREFDPAEYSTIPQPDPDSATTPIVVIDFLQNLRDARQELDRPGIGTFSSAHGLPPSDSAPTIGWGNPLTKRNS